MTLKLYIEVNTPRGGIHRTFALLDNMKNICKDTGMKSYKVLMQELSRSNMPQNHFLLHFFIVVLRKFE